MCKIGTHRREMMNSYRVSGTYLFALVVLAGCSSGHALMPTPNLYTDANAPLFGDLPTEYENTKVELVYITDRAPERDEDGKLFYGYRRSNVLSVGTTIVDLGEDVTWAQLLEASRSQSRSIDFKLQLESISEYARLPPIPLPYQVVDGKPVNDPDAVAELDASLEPLWAEIARRMALTPRKDVFLFVHGYHNTFDDAAFALAELWHFLGREGVPLVYTWPAGYPGLFGYTYDRESSEFTVYHLRQVIKWLSGLPEVENIHLIAHSRGADVAITAFRELVIWARGAGTSARERFKIANLILAAADLDLQVMDQRIIADRLGMEVGQVTIYSSPDDRAIGIAETLFASPRGRLGTLDLSELNKEEISALKANEGRVTVVNFHGKSKGYGHSYFWTNPSVSSDVVLLLRYGIRPGEPGRPLEHLGQSFWRIPPGYPKNTVPQ